MKHVLFIAAMAMSMSAGAACNSEADGGCGITSYGGSGGNAVATSVNNNDNRNTNTNITTNTNVNTNTQGQQQGQLQGQLQGQVQSADNKGNKQTTSLTVQGDDYKVSTAYAAPLVASPDTCMGSSSGGLQGAAIGISIGSTWTDNNCVRLKLSRELRIASYAAAADALLCMNDDVREAMRLAGTACPQDKQAKSASATSNTVAGTDNLVTASAN